MVIKFALVMQCLGPAEAIQRCSLALQADAIRSQSDTPRLGGHHCHLLPHISIPEKAHSGFITHIYCTGFQPHKWWCLAIQNMMMLKEKLNYAFFYIT